MELKDSMEVQLKDSMEVQLQWKCKCLWRGTCQQVYMGINTSYNSLSSPHSPTGNHGSKRSPHGLPVSTVEVDHHTRLS